MTKTRLLTIAVVGLLLINFGLLAFWAYNRPMHPPQGQSARPGGGGPKEMIVKKLEFSKEQITGYERLIEKHQVAIRALNDEVSNTKNSLYEALPDDAGSGVDSLIKRLGTLQTQIEQTHYDHFTEVKKLCRPDQQDNFRELTSELAGYFATPGNPPPNRQQAP